MTQALPDDPAGDAPPRLPPDLPQSTVSEIVSWLVGHTLDAVERELIRHTLESCGGDRVLAASILGLSLPGLRRKLTAYAVRGQALPEPAAGASERRADAPANESRAEHADESDVRANEGGLDLRANDSGVHADANGSGAGVDANESGPDLREQESGVEADANESGADADASESGADVRADEGRRTGPIPQADNDREPAPGAVAPQPEKPKMMDVRLLIGGALTTILIALIGLGLFGRDKQDADFVSLDRARIEVSVLEKPVPFQQRITVPAWVGPSPLRAAPAAVVDGAGRAQTGSAAAAVAARHAEETPAPFDSRQDTRMELAAIAPTDRADTAARTGDPLATVDIAEDTRMELAAARESAAPSGLAIDLAAVDIAEDTRMKLAAARESAAPSGFAIDLAAVDIAQDTRMELAAARESAAPSGLAIDLAAVDIAQDTRMELAAARDSAVPSGLAIDLAAVDIAQDTRMELVAAAEQVAALAPQTTGSIDSAAWFVAPEEVPAPLARPESFARPEPVRPAKRRAARTRPTASPPPVQAEAPARTVPLIFPFNLFADRDSPRAAGDSTIRPAECCRNH